MNATGKNQYSGTIKAAIVACKLLHPRWTPKRVAASVSDQLGRYVSQGTVASMMSKLGYTKRRKRCEVGLRFRAPKDMQLWLRQEAKQRGLTLSEMLRVCVNTTRFNLRKE